MARVSTLVSFAILLTAVRAVQLRGSNTQFATVAVSLSAHSSVVHELTLSPCLGQYAAIQIPDSHYSISVKYLDNVIVTSQASFRERQARLGGDMACACDGPACEEYNLSSNPAVVVKPSLLRQYFDAEEQNCTLKVFVNNTAATDGEVSTLYAKFGDMLTFQKDHAGQTDNGLPYYGIEIEERNLNVMFKLRTELKVPGDGITLKMQIFDEVMFPFVTVYPPPTMCGPSDEPSRGVSSFVLKEDGLSWNPGLYIIIVTGISKFEPKGYHLTIEPRYKHGYAMNLSIVAGIGALTILVLCLFAGCVALAKHRHARMHQSGDGSDAGSQVSGSDGASKADIEALQLKPFQEMAAGAGATRCAICLNDFTDCVKLRVLPCDHYFHTHCAEAWLTRRRRCPLCLRNIGSGEHIAVVSHDDGRPLDAVSQVASSNSRQLEVLSAAADTESPPTVCALPSTPSSGQSGTPPSVVSVGAGRVGRWQNVAEDGNRDYKADDAAV